MGNYSFSAERIIGKHFSLVGGVGYYPTGKLPYSSVIADLAKDEEGYIDMLQVNNQTLSLEMRFYTGRKGYGRGFYISPYYRYGKSGFDNIQTEYTNDEEEVFDISLNGNLKTHSGGILLGCQWLAGKRKNIVIDWSIFGGHVGYMNGNAFRKTSETLTTEDQQDIKESIDEKLDENLGEYPFLKYTTTVTANSADVNLKGPWAFIRGSLSIGIRL